MKKVIPFLLLAALFAGAAWYSFFKEPEAVHEVPSQHSPPAIPVTQQLPDPVIAEPLLEGQDEEIQEVAEPEPMIAPDPLPILSDSDSQVTQDLAVLTGTDPLAEYLVKGEVISRIVTTIDSISTRQVPALINPVKPADGKFVALEEGESMVMSDQNFARYDGYVSMLQAVDASALVVLYQRYYPLFQQAWEENGGEGSFNERLIEVLEDLLETPDVPGPVYLSKPEAVYVFEDPELEAMTAGQKILVRMGSVNASIVKEKLLEIRRLTL
jgi:hypothetical protein